MIVSEGMQGAPPSGFIGRGVSAGRGPSSSLLHPNAESFTTTQSRSPQRRVVHPCGANDGSAAGVPSQCVIWTIHRR